MSMFSIVRKKPQYENMSHFNSLPEFEKDLKRLSKKYPSLRSDLDDLEAVLREFPTGMGKNFTIIHHSATVKIGKTRLACKSLRDRSMRLVYAYHEDKITFVHIELYFKGDKENGDRERIKEYLKNWDMHLSELDTIGSM